VQVVPRQRSRAPGTATGPIVLATLASRLDPEAERVAIESALETGAPLVMVNAVISRCAPRTPSVPREEDYDAVRATADRAAALGIRTELLRIRSPHPAKAIVQVAVERAAALVVLGPARVRRWRLRRAIKALRRGTDCLVWVAPNA
jgi:nucleotide-binding universal stress UspA family protein